MNLVEAQRYLGRRVAVVCADGTEFIGGLCTYQSFAEDPDEPETIGIAEVPGFITEIPIQEIASIEEVA